MSAPRTAQKLEVTFKKLIHLRDYENEEFSGTNAATFDGPLTFEESVAELAKLQAEVEYSVFHILHTRKLITTHAFDIRKHFICSQLAAIGVEDASKYIEGMNESKE